MTISASDLPIVVPAHIAALATAIKYDVYHGPAWAILPDNIENFTADHFATFAEDIEGEYVGKLVPIVDLIPILSEWVDTLPTLYYESWSGCVVTEQEDDSIYMSRREILTTLFGDRFGPVIEYL